MRQIGPASPNGTTYYNGDMHMSRWISSSKFASVVAIDGLRTKSLLG
jgi:hypothetical protein